MFNSAENSTSLSHMRIVQHSVDSLSVSPHSCKASGICLDLLQEAENTRDKSRIRWGYLGASENQWPQYRPPK